MKKQKVGGDGAVYVIVEDGAVYVIGADGAAVHVIHRELLPE